MPAIRPGFMVETPATSFGLGKSDTTSRRIAFSVSPIHNGTFKDEDVRRSFFQPAELVGGELSDGGYAFGTVKRYYQDTPNLEEVEVGGGGKPASP